MSTATSRLQIRQRTGDRASNGDGGNAEEAALGTPTALFVDGRGNTYIAEWTGHRIRKVSPTGQITSIGVVAFSDFLIFVDGFGKASADIGFDGRLDLLEDGQIDFTDLLRFARAFGKRE
jgi:hypothetical protein